ncbi:histone acetylation protein-domain-containing protein [Hypoxylon crocopeplum]|nr:histone acetylation protein-domain-containing protein [Hypoxylon crocopeplum]
MSGPGQARGGGRAGDLDPLVVELAKVLPKDYKFAAHHLSTPPTITEPLCYPSPYNPTSDSKDSGEAQRQSKERRPSESLKTYCEKHFLAISIEVGKGGTRFDRQVLVLGLEIYIYTTSFSTIIFVSKADSTGYLTLLSLPKGTPSPIREVTTCFLAYLIANRRRPTKQLVVNLFARAQSQYLFPGSVKNSGKHVLDDRGLVKWWCRVLNSLLEDGDYSGARRLWDTVHGYLIIPGLDIYETRAFLPRTGAASTSWTLGDPLEKISPYTKDRGTFGNNIHPRFLIPTYPDDPKARFVQELEESMSEKAKLLSGWKSPKTLDQFWEMMTFRQECSSGRMTGFIWVVFEPRITSIPDSPAASSAAIIQTPNTSFSSPTDNERPATPRPTRQRVASLMTPTSLPSKRTKRTISKARGKRKEKKVLTGPIITRQPQVKAHQQVQFPELVETPYYSWPENGRGQVVLNDNSYKRAIELLLHLKFETLEQAIVSTARWTNGVNGGKDWALEIVGERATAAPTTSSSTGGAVNNLDGLIKRKRAPDSDTTDCTTLSAPSVNTLGGMLVRKKAKLDASDTTDISGQNPDRGGPIDSSEPKVNVLGAGLVRKKLKTP